MALSAHFRHAVRVRFLRYIVVSWALNAVVLGIVVAIFDNANAKNFGDLLIAALVFGVLNTIIKPILRLLTLPVAVITLGLAWFFVAMFMLWLTSTIVSGFDIHGFWTYVWATVVVWAVNVVIELVEWHHRRGEEKAAAAAKA
jgi:putative membrane protein